MLRINERVSLLIVAATLTVTTAYGDESRYQTQVNRDLPYRGGAVTIDHQFGSVTINTGSSSQVNVRATIRASDPEYGRQIQILTDSAANGVTIRTQYPSGRTTRDNHFSYSVDYQIAVPATAPVRVRNRFGSVKATGIAGGSQIVNGHGSITLSEGRGSQTVENQFGSIQMRDIGGDVVIRNSHGSVRADDVRGSADVSNRFGSVAVAEVRGDAVVKNANGSVSVRDVRGAANVVNSFGSLGLQSVIGSVRVNGNHSRVTVRDVRGNADVTTTFGSVDVQNISGALNVTNNNGSVKAADIHRDASIRTSFASVVLSDMRGAIDVQNQNGGIAVSRVVPSGCRPITLRTSFSSIKLALPSNANYAVAARTTHGRINSALPITTTSIGGETVVGTIGRGACKLELINTNGSITIEEE